MKLFAVGRNYAEHARELNNPVPADPVIFMKPETAILKDNKPFFIPDFSSEIHHEIEVVVRICKGGKSIREEFAHRYYDMVTVGVDFTARDLQSRLKSNGFPWEISKGFDGSAPIGTFVPVEQFSDLQRLDFGLKLNGNWVQEGNTAEMIFGIDKLIAWISKFFTLQMGDLLFTGTPAGVGPVAQGDRLQGFLDGNLLLDFEVR